MQLVSPMTHSDVEPLLEICRLFTIKHICLKIIHLPYVFAGSDKKIKEFEEAPGSGTQITKEIDAGTNLTQVGLLSAAKVMFAATESGALRTYKFPLTGEYCVLPCVVCHQKSAHTNYIHSVNLGFIISHPCPFHPLL